MSFSIDSIVSSTILFISFLLLRSYRGVIKNVYIGLIVIINLLITMLTKFFWDRIVGTYWFDRVKAYLNPEEYSKDLAWQINSSYDAIGSGGLFGKGLGNGMLTEFKMMPIYESDFIIAALAEQFGLYGVFILILLLGYFFYWLVTYLDKCLNKYVSYIVLNHKSMILKLSNI